MTIDVLEDYVQDEDDEEPSVEWCSHDVVDNDPNPDPRPLSAVFTAVGSYDTGHKIDIHISLPLYDKVDIRQISVYFVTVCIGPFPLPLC